VRLQTRTFLVCFVPFALLLTVGFWMIQRLVQSAVGDGVRATLRDNQFAIARLHSKSDLQNSRFLRVVSENAALKSGIQLLVSESHSPAARRTVEDQLRELGELMGFDFLLVSAPDGTPLAAVVREPSRDADGASQLVPVDTTALESNRKGLLLIGGRAFQVASVPVDQDQENIGVLSVGEFFDFSEFTTPAVLLHNGVVINSNISSIPYVEIGAALRNCPAQSECDIRLRGANWVSLPMQSGSMGEGYQLRSLQNMDAAIAPVQTILHDLFLAVDIGCVVVALLCSLISSRSIVRPIAGLVSHLRNSEHTGVLPEFESNHSSIFEIRQLVENYNHAAVAVRAARDSLHDAYVEFVGSLANALDARDHYTAGHSMRVSELSSATAAAMQLDREHIERIRVGALLHDIGKIGIADAILQKTGRLTDEEFAIVKKHPVIGRQILEGVGGLTPFLDAVELHHENWDGSGYPKGQSGEQTPVDARIIHVSDAYDAMTTNRSYRRGLTHRRAIEILHEYAGIQFDPRIVEVFAQLPLHNAAAQREAEPETSPATQAALEPAPVPGFEAWEAI
jgi:putative nucleotidyltransferase with HDIG domain